MYDTSNKRLFRYIEELGGNRMNPLLITIIVILVIGLVTFGMTYLVRKRYYQRIDELDQQKNQVLKKAPYDELKEVNKLNISGQSLQLRKKLEQKWNEIESVKYPRLENNLFDAEQSTDRYRLVEAKKSQDRAEEALDEINEDLEMLKNDLVGLIEREQANLVKIDEIKKRYHEIRKSLLAHSFSFGPASETFEKNLRLMEVDFTDFSNITISGDHEEANAVVKRLNEDIEIMDQQMKEVPPLLDILEDEYVEQFDDIQQGYEQMSDAGYLFPDDTVIEDLDKLKIDKKHILDRIRVLELEEAKEETEALGKEIDEMYDRLDMEYQAKPAAQELLEDSKRGLYFLQDENRRLNAFEKRMEQSYILIHNEAKTIEKLGEEVKMAREEYNFLEDRMKHQALPYSVIYERLAELFDELGNLNDEYNEVAEFLENYRHEELAFKDELYRMEQQMYRMKRRLENERLPGLPNDYLELFFSTTERIERFDSELSRPKINLVEIQKVYEICNEDVKQLETMTYEMVRQVELTERTSQKLYRYKDTHKGILETIRYSESLFNSDYDYEMALRLVKEKLENVAPGEYAKVVQAYEVEKEQQ